MAVQHQRDGGAVGYPGRRLPLAAVFVLSLPVHTITRTHPSGTESSVTAPL